METIKKVVYREEDKALVSEAQSNKVNVSFVPALTVEQQAACNNLKGYCETQIETPLNYVVYLADGNTLNIQDMNNNTVVQVVSELSMEVKAIVDAVGLLCTQLLNA